MDFLDPRKQRAYRLRLMIGYALVAVAIGLSTVILVYGAYGYSINTKTGDIVQNGLLFVGSKPGDAHIYLDGKSQNSTTSARLILPAKTYTLKLKKSGYRDWQRTFVLNEHSIERYVYTFLFPIELNAKALKSYPSLPLLMAQSPDRRWLLVQAPSNTPQTLSLDEYDTTDPAKLNRTFPLAPALLTNFDQATSGLSVVEWAADNNHLLLKHTNQTISEFIIINRSDPTKSVNINKLLNITPTSVTLRNKNVEQLYIFDQTAATLQVASLAEAALHPPFLKQVLAYKPSGNNLLTYVTNLDAPVGQAAARIWDNGATYQLAVFPAGEKYLIDVGRFQDHWYYAAGSSATPRISIYKDPLSGLKNPAIARAVPMISLPNQGASEITFSTNSRFIALQGGQKFAVYDIEEQNSYNYGLGVPLDGPMRWMDGHRLMGVSGGHSQVVDFDGTNLQSLAPTLVPEGGYFDRSLNQLFSLSAQPGGAVSLLSTELRAGVDLPN